MRRRRPIVLALVALAVAMAAAGVSVLVVLVAADAAFYARFVPALERDLGFTCGSPLVRAGADTQEVMTLYPTRGGPMEQAGMRDGDIVPDCRSTTDFYRRLEAARGRHVSFTVIEGGDGPPLDTRAARVITLRVPARETGHPHR